MYLQEAFVKTSTAATPKPYHPRNDTIVPTTTKGIAFFNIAKYYTATAIFRAQHC